MTWANSGHRQGFRGSFKWAALDAALKCDSWPLCGAEGAGFQMQGPTGDSSYR